MTFSNRVEQLKAQLQHTWANKRSYQERVWEPTYKELYGLYHQEQLSQAQIAKRVGVGKRTVQERMKELGIPSRSLSVAAKVHWKRGRRSRNIDAEEC